eukprot:4139374-Pyramimonas_sp.AAC.1
MSSTEDLRGRFRMGKSMCSCASGGLVYFAHCVWVLRKVHVVSEGQKGRNGTIDQHYGKER